MSAKRAATKELTDRNWDQEDEEEEAGIFVKASDDQLQQRKIKTAKRRGTGGGEESGTKSAFAGFSGFSSMKPAGTTPSFNFGSGTKSLSGLAGNKSVLPSTNPFASSSNSSFTFKSSNSASFTSSSATVSKVSTNTSEAVEQGTTNTSSLTVSNGSTKTSVTPKKTEKKSEYLRQLKNLNLSISEWIKKHLDDNPYCVLTPVFNDYEKYLNMLDRKYPEAGTSTSSSDMKSDEGSDKSVEKDDLTKAKRESESKVEKSDTKGFTPTKGFTFGSTSASSEIPTNTSSSSGLTTNTSAGFTFGSTANSGSLTKPFSFMPSADSAPKPGQTTAATNEDDEYVPPKTEVTAVNEEGAFYSKRCKLFYQKEGAWVEKGVGNLHLKSIGEKTQLVIRADTNLGNILLNIMLSSSIPIRRQGKNNVSMMCIPNPPIDPKGDDSKATMLLIRVKTAEDADEVYSKMSELKG